MAANSNLDLKNLFSKVSNNLEDLLILAEKDTENDEARELIMKQAASSASNLVDKFAEVEDRIASLKPHATAADVEAEIKSLEKELKEKSDLIHKIQTKLDVWTKELKA